jgi:peptidoglycan LD-endopeptidase CwlK
MVFVKNKRERGIIILLIMGAGVWIYVRLKDLSKITEIMNGQSENFLSDRNALRMEGIDSRLIAVVNEVSRTTNLSFNVGKSGGIRSAVLQNELYLDGKSQKDGYINLSNHQLGEAVDLYPIKGGAIADYQYNQLAEEMKEAAESLGISIRWGGDWSNFVDKPHFELDE